MNREYFEYLKLSDECRSAIDSCCDFFGKSQAFAALINDIETGRSFAETEKDCFDLAEKTRRNPYTIMLTLIMATLDFMKSRYLAAGVCEDIFYDTITDIPCKISECREVCGVYGIFAFSWYELFYKVQLFKFGRLEYQPTAFMYDTVTLNGETVKKGDFVLSVHIPSSGPLKADEVLESKKKAFDFFKDKTGGRLPLMCSSWLLFEPFAEVFKKASPNIYRFAGEFKIIKNYYDDNFSFWRVFGTYETNTALLPEKTSLQRAFKEYIKSGGKTGSGVGIQIFKPTD